MELVYSMRRKPLKCEPPHFESIWDPEVIRPIVTISSGNIIAFSSPTELSDTEGDSWGGHVYVCDLDTPWDSHKVTSTVHSVSTLEWDNDGKQLLVATTVGEVSVYGQKDFLLNEWTCLYTATIPGEHIIKAIFYHNGRRLVSLDKKPDALIADRIQMLRSTPTLKGFGGVPAAGALVISATGLVAALTPLGDGRAAVASDSLRPRREHLLHAALAHKNGNILVAGVCGAWRSGPCAVRAALCALARPPPPGPPPGPPPPGGAPLALQPLPAVSLRRAPASITWCLREDTDSLLIAGSTLTLWKLTERSHPIHKLLIKGPVQGNTTPGGGPKPGTDCFNTVVWQQTAAWKVEGGESAVHVASGKLPLGPPHAALLTPRALHLISRDSHHPLASRTLGGAGEGPPGKKAKYSGGARPGGGGSCAITCCADLSLLGGAIVAVDTHSQLHVLRVQPAVDIPAPLVIQHTASLLEYALVSGYDCLDVQFTLSGKHSVIEAVLDRLTESFQRQPAAFQQYYYHSWLKLRIALCRLVPAAQSSVSWLTCLQTLGALWAAACAALRPDERPDGPLAALLSDHDDKALLTLEAKGEVCSEATNAAALALLPLRRPLQRAADIAGTVLAAVHTHPHPHPHTHSHQHQSIGYTLQSDPSGMVMLRKLLCLSRGLCGDGRLLARLQGQPKPDLIEECLAASSARARPRVWEALPRVAVCAPHGAALPLHLEYGVEPEALRYSPEPPASFQQCDIAPSQDMDSIRCGQMGGDIERGLKLNERQITYWRQVLDTRQEWRQFVSEAETYFGSLNRK